MQVSKTTRSVSHSLGILGILLILGGCLSGDAEDESAAPHFQQRQQITLTGSVGDGPVVGAAMAATTPTDEVIAEFESDMRAGYSVVLEVPSSEFPLIISATGGTDLVTNLAPDFDLSGAALASDTAATANVNPFTTFAVEVANRIAGGPTASNIADAEDLVVAALDTGLTTVLVQGPLATPVDETNVAEIVRASEALAEIVRRTRDRLAIPASDVIAAISADLTDGMVDGVGTAQANPRIAAVWSLISAQVLLETVTNTLYVNGSDATSAMDAAITSVSSGTPEPSLQELIATTAMLDRTRVGLSAAWAITGDPEIADLVAAVDRMWAGMSASLAKIALPNDFRSRLGTAIGMAVTGDNSVVDTVNAVVRQGGTAITPNNIPEISGDPSATVEVGSPYDFTPIASDADGDVLTFSIAGKPTWATFAASSGRLSGTPGVSDAGTYADIRISVSDGSDTSSLAAFSIEVTEGNAAPTIGGSPETVVAFDTAYSFLPDADDPDGDTLTFSISNPPAWAAFDSSTGQLSGTPGSSDVGSYLDIVITVSDGQQSASLGPFTLNVVADNAPPSIEGAGGATLETGAAYDFQPIAGDPDGDPLIFTITNQPSWTAFDSATGRLSGTPTANDEGTFANIIIRVNDGELTSSLAAFTIRVTVPNSAPTIGGTPETQVDAGEPYSFTPTANDTDGDNLSFSISGRPSWANFSQSTGQLSGTPGNGNAGTYSNIRISVTDGTDSATLPAFSITVDTTNSAPTISGTPAAAVNANTAYSFTPTANDADGDTLVFSITGLPGWGNFDTTSGRLAGTPGDADVGVYGNIRITVSDGDGSATLGPFSISVNAVSNGSATLSWQAPTENTDGSALTDLAGYKLYWRTGSGAYQNSATINNPSVTTYIVENLAPATYEFVATAFNSQNIESNHSASEFITVP